MYLRLKRIIQLILILIVAQIFHPALQAKTTVKNQEPIKITGTRNPIKNSIENTYIPIKTDSNKLTTSISELIEKESGIHLRRYGAPGTYSTLSIRGSNNNQIGVFINNISFNNPFTGSLNLENLPFNIFSEVEIYKSYTPSFLSGSYVGGSINLLTKRPRNSNKPFFF